MSFVLKILSRLRIWYHNLDILYLNKGDICSHSSLGPLGDENNQNKVCPEGTVCRNKDQNSNDGTNYCLEEENNTLITKFFRYGDICEGPKNVISNFSNPENKVCPEGTVCIHQPVNFTEDDFAFQSKFCLEKKKPRYYYNHLQKDDICEYAENITDLTLNSIIGVCPQGTVCRHHSTGEDKIHNPKFCLEEQKEQEHKLSEQKEQILKEQQQREQEQEKKLNEQLSKEHKKKQKEEEREKKEFRLIEYRLRSLWSL